MQDGTRLAAVDLGSNSFRLEIGRLDHGLIRRTDYLKETVRQGGGLDEQRNLTPHPLLMQLEQVVIQDFIITSISNDKEK